MITPGLNLPTYKVGSNNTLHILSISQSFEMDGNRTVVLGTTQTVVSKTRVIQEIELVDRDGYRVAIHGDVKLVEMILEKLK